MMYSATLLKLLVSAFSANIALLVLATIIVARSRYSRHHLRNVLIAMCATFVGSYVVLSIR